MALNIDDIVWIKMKGSPYWPGAIADDSDCIPVPKSSNHIFVYFFGSDNYAHVPGANILPFMNPKVEEMLTKRSAAFKNAIEHLKAYSEETGNASVLATLKTPPKVIRLLLEEVISMVVMTADEDDQSNAAESDATTDGSADISDADDPTYDPTPTETTASDSSFDGWSDAEVQEATVAEEPENSGSDADKLNPEGKVSRKRHRNTKQWKRNLMKNAVARGEAHVNYKGSAIPAKRAATGVNLCGAKECSKKCDSRITEALRAALHQHFYTELDKDGKRRYIFSTQRPQAIKRRKPGVSEKNKRSCQWKSVITVAGAEHEICLPALAALLCVSQSHIKSVRNAPVRDQAAGPSPHGSGKHSNRRNQIPDELRRKVICHIKQFPAESSHYSREANPNRKYLAATLSIAKMHQLFLEQQRNQGDAASVTLHYYRDVFGDEFNLGFGTPRTDICGICERNDIGCDEHHQKAAEATERMKSDRVLATEGKVLYITFDLQKTLPLPKLAVSEAFYLPQLWMYNLGVHAVDNNTGREGRGIMYTWTENEFGRGCSEVGSAILAFAELPDYSHNRHLVAWSDSCGGQNKNFFILGLWQFLVRSGRFLCIDHKFPEVGHSRLDSDRDFAHIEQAVRKEEKIALPDQYRTIMSTCQRKNPFKIINLANGMIDLKKLIKSLNLVKRTKTTSNEKVNFKTDVRWVRVNTFGKYQYRTSFDEYEEWKIVDILKKRSSFGEESSEDMLRSCAIPPGRPVKTEKYDDVMKLQKYVDRYAHGFYTSLARANNVEEYDSSS